MVRDFSPHLNSFLSYALSFCHPRCIYLVYNKLSMTLILSQICHAQTDSTISIISGNEGPDSCDKTVEKMTLK